MVFSILILAAVQLRCAAPDPKAIMEKVTLRDVQNEKMRREYTYLERQEERELDGSGKPTKTTVNEFEHVNLYGENHRRHISKDGKPLSAKDAQREKEKLDKIVAARQNESAGERAKRLQDADRRAEHRRRFSRQIPNIYDFSMLPDEKLAGRDVYVIKAEPKPGYRPVDVTTRAMAKMHGTFWIDKSTNQMVKLDAEALDTVSFGFFLVRLAKGAHFILEQIRVNDEVWLPKRVQAAIDARIAVVKKFRGQFDVTYSNYRKFQSDSRIVEIATEPRP
jgi:hypothetical protein